MTALLAALSLLPGFEKELRLLPLLVRRGAVCIDVGASLGVYSIPMAVLAGASGAVLAFEPRTGAARRLRRLADVFKLEALHVEAAALGATATSSGLVVPRRRRAVPGRSYLTAGAVRDGLEDGLVGGRSVNVPVRTLDSIRSQLDRPVDFVKCDVEGFELEVFRGGRNVLCSDRPVVLCEMEERHASRYGRTVSDVVSLFADAGYVRVELGSASVDSPPRNVVFAPEERPPPRCLHVR